MNEFIQKSLDDEEDEKVHELGRVSAEVLEEVANPVESEPEKEEEHQLPYTVSEVEVPPGATAAKKSAGNRIKNVTAAVFLALLVAASIGGGIGL